MNKILSLFVLIFSFVFHLEGQMEIDGQLLFGNEWLNFDQNYYKIKVSEDGIYRLTGQQLAAAGIPLAEFSGDEIVLYNYGEEVPIRVTTNGNLLATDYIEFYGRRNRASLDNHLFENWEQQQLNLDYSMFSADNVYFLSWEQGDRLRYEELNNDLGGSLPAKEEFYFHEELIVYDNFHYSPTLDSQNVRFSHFNASEGFGTDLTVKTEIVFETNNVNPDGSDPYAVVRAGVNNVDHKLEFSFNDDIKFTEEFFGNKVENYLLPLSYSEIESTNRIFIKGRGTNNQTIDKNLVGHASLFYARRFQANGANYLELELEASSSERYFEIEDFDNSSEVFVYDPWLGERLSADIFGNLIRFKLPASSGARKLVIANLDIIRNDVEIAASDDFVDFTTENPNYVILTSKELNSNATIQQYADFRASQLGGEHNTFIVEYEQLRDQFGYGIENHPIGISNFAQYVQTRWPALKFFFIIGKSLEYHVLREGVNTAIKLQVPTHGDPGSDHLLFAEKGDPYSYVPVGRLAAQTEEDVLNYLEKSMSYAEAANTDQDIASKEWTKKVLHLAGGDPTIQDRIFGHLSDMGDIIKESKMGAEVQTFQKVSNSPTQNPLSEEILQSIDEGATIVTFFGHSSAGTFDFSIEDPSKYNNADKLPFVLSLGCHSGNIHSLRDDDLLGISENFVLQEKTGAIAFLASSGSAYISPQYEGGKILYDLIGNEFYGATIGEIINASLKKGETEIPIQPAQKYRIESLIEQLTLHGDPATKFISSPGPDFITDFSSISTLPQVISTSIDSFELSFDIVNLGSVFDGTLKGTILHSYGQSIDSISFSLPAPANRNNFKINIPQKGFSSIGKNIIEILLDPEDEIDELPAPRAEENNSIKTAYAEEGFCFFVFDNNAIPIYPSEFAIVNKTDFDLIASTNNALLPVQNFQFQIDTTELFDSPLLEVGNVQSGGGKIPWRPSVNYQENTVYYWRIRNLDADIQGQEVWNTSSFIYLPDGSEGWNQSHYYQWRKNELSTAEIDEFSREFEFQDDFKSIAITNGVYSECSPLIVYQNEPSEFIPWDAPVNAGIWVAVFDEFSGEPWRNEPGGLYNSTMNTPWAIDFIPFPYWTRTPEERKDAMDFLNDIIPDGAFVAVLTIQYSSTSYLPELWGEDLLTYGRSLYSILEAQGAERIRELETLGPQPYLFVYKKNDPSFDPVEQMGNTANCFTQDFQISAKWFEGKMASKTVGPALEWETLEWELGDYDDTDTIAIRLIGIDANGNEELIENDINQEIYPLNNIDALQYPFLKLEFDAIDETKRTSPYLDYWRIRFKELPEAVLNTNENFVFQKDTLKRGEELVFTAIAENIRELDMDSLLVRYTIVDESNLEQNEDQRLEPLTGLKKLDLDFRRSTSDLAGPYQLRVEINAAREQREEHYFNNLGILRFYVEDDAVNPLLDVTFDGIHIFNGDIISPEPNICVTLKDASGTLLDNPEDFELVLQFPDGSFETIDILGPDVTFYPADSIEDNEAKLVYTPSLQTGDYILFVQAKDGSGNFSGDQDQSFEFRVIKESKISNVLNYPNPFSNSTQFIFTITGTVPPQDFHIKVFTLSGKVVKEITLDELGPLNIGVNRSRLKWNGTDDYGSKLANGVYLYKVYSSFDQEQDSHFDLTAVDDYFKKGFGKLVIIR